MKTTNLKWIAYALSALMLMQSCGVYQGTPISDSIYKTWVKSVDGKVTKGVLYRADEAKITVKKKYINNATVFIEIEPNDIDFIKVKSMKKARKGALYGSLAGAGIGALRGGTSSGGYFDPEASAVIGAIIFAIPGSIIGSAISAKKTKIYISSDIHLYNENLKLIKSYCEKNNTP